MEGVGALLAGCPPAGLAGGLGVTVCAAAGGAWLYKMARRKKPTHTTVNCWFCNQDTVVPYGNRNCWDCPNCEQYNGFQENGDYNKPIPAQYMEHLNHVVTGAAACYDPTKPQQWVSSQVLLCKKCNSYQTLKIKQLASFMPREEGKYDEEIEVYKHHLEQTYKLCRPCQAAVEYYIKHQNRQLRALLLRHHFSHRKMDHSYMQSFYAAASAASTTTPIHVLALRFLAFLSCAILIAMGLYGSGNPFSPGPASPPPSSLARNGSEAASPSNGTLLEFLDWREMVHLLPDQLLAALSAVWTYGKNHQVAVVALGLTMCILAMLLAGRIRLRRIDAFASVLWLLVMSFHLAEKYLQADTPSWLDTAKFSTTSLCCLVGFAAAVATRKSTGQQRPHSRRYFSGDPVAAFPSSAGLGFPYSPAAASAFIPTPPSVLPLMNQQFFHSPRRASSSSLPGRLNRALSLGTIPSLARTDSGYLFSGSRPPSQTSYSKESPVSEYFSFLSGSCVSSPIPSPAPSVAGSVTSSSSSLRYRRPLISPARLNLKGQRLLLFPSQGQVHHGDDHVHSENSVFASEVPTFPKRNLGDGGMHDVRAVIEAGSVCSHRSVKRQDDSSHSSSCVVDTTTKGEELTGWRGRFGNSAVRGLLAASLTVNAIFTSAYLYQSFR
ncbi:transmembrane protein 201 isoform X2 [Sphaerodactylus townsendi]|uniref:transmembrane protein 201 isoform X2 n=1 Tax=Sphaerodactylus townsendi TaxID=933632 RepID=UPI002025C120|nr:transmembrane protein 201 isoform X2 [Sphaerodactylus townsendi]